MSATGSEANQAVIDRIRKLLQHASAEGHHSEGEVESALNLARKLMEKHNIEEGAVLASQETARQSAYDTVKEEDVVSRVGAVPTWLKNIARATCNICDTNWYSIEKAERDKLGNFVRGKNGFTGEERKRKLERCLETLNHIEYVSRLNDYPVDRKVECMLDVQIELTESLLDLHNDLARHKEETPE